MADAGAAPPLPTQKTRGWEFTDLSELDLDAYVAATGGDPEARSRADGVLNPPEGADHLVVQVDGATLEGASVEVEGDGRPHEPLVASLALLTVLASSNHLCSLVAARSMIGYSAKSACWTGGSEW